jgi:hypothetical protein
MVLESIIGEKKIRKHPVLIFFLTIVISFGSIFFANLLFPKYSSVLSVAFVTIGLVPLVFNVLSKEEADEVLSKRSCTTFLLRHFNIIMIFVWIFVGIIVSYAIFYSLAAPAERASLFTEQISAFCSISGECKDGVPYSISGRISASGMNACLSNNSSIESCTLFIFENNAGVLLFTILLSLLYGVGAIFIIAWNASILGVFFGETFINLSHVKWVGMIQSMLIGHGPPELLGYVFGALAGAILSSMVAKGQLLTHDAEVIIKDVFFLSALAFFSVAYGAVTEAVGILKMGELYFLMGFLYLFVIIVALFLYNSTRPSPKFCM